MADKDLSLKVGDVGSLAIKPTFEGGAVAVGKISLDEAASDLKGLVTIGAFTAGAAGVVNIPVTAIAAGVQDAILVFKYADAGVDHADTENWGKSTRTVAFTISAADALARLIDVTTPLTMDLWATQPLTFKVVKGEGAGENDISPTITSVTVDPTSIADKFEFTADVGTSAYTFKSIASSTTEVVTATAKLTVVGEDAGVPYSLEADIVLNTNINDGEIPTNRFDVQFQ